MADIYVPGMQQEAPSTRAVQETASLMERLLAYFLDSVIFLVLCYAGLYYVVNFKGMAFTPQLHLKAQLLSFGAFMLYAAIFSCGGLATLGKFLMGLRVRRADTMEPLSFIQSFMRAIGYAVSSLPFYGGFIIALVTPEHRALHDFMAGSVVVRVDEKSPLMKTLIGAAASAVALLLGYGLYVNGVLGMTEADKQMLAQAHAQMGKLDYLEQLHKHNYGSYTNNFDKLAQLSGNPYALRQDLLKSVDAESLEIGADIAGYQISGRAKNAQRTQIIITGPAD